MSFVTFWVAVVIGVFVAYSGISSLPVTGEDWNAICIGVLILCSAFGGIGVRMGTDQEKERQKREWETHNREFDHKDA